MEETHGEAMPSHNIQNHGKHFMEGSKNDGGIVPCMNPELNEGMLEREILKRKIREEIIASEMSRRQQLEAEVRMELMMENYVLGMRNFNGFDHHVKFMKPGFWGFQPSPNYGDYLLNLGVSDDNDERKMKFMECKANPEQFNVKVCEEKVQNQDVALGKWPFDRDPIVVSGKTAGKSNVVPVEEVEMAQVTPCSGITGVKRKGETAARTCDEETVSTTCEDRQKLYCSICEVSATSDVTLNGHYQGKKHKAKLAKLKASDHAGIISMDHRSADNTVQAMEPAMSMEQRTNTGINKWECSLCQVSATSELLLISHLQGKKHKAKEALQIGKATSNKEGLAPAEPQEVGLASAEPQELADPSSYVGAINPDKRWYCSVCGVTTSSENNFNDHLKGRKHRAKAGLPPPEVDIAKESSLPGVRSPKNEQGTTSPSTLGCDKQKELDLSTKSSVEPTKIPLNKNKDSSLQAPSEAGVLVRGQTDAEKPEASLPTSELEKRGSMEFGKYWLCKMCSKGTYDEATMAAHRKSEEHMALLVKKGGCVITVSNIPKEALQALDS